MIIVRINKVDQLTVVPKPERYSCLLIVLEVVMVRQHGTGCWMVAPKTWCLGGGATEKRVKVGLEDEGGLTHVLTLPL